MKFNFPVPFARLIKITSYVQPDKATVILEISKAKGISQSAVSSTFLDAAIEEYLKDENTPKEIKVPEPAKEEKPVLSRREKFARTRKITGKHPGRGTDGKMHWFDKDGNGAYSGIKEAKKEVATEETEVPTPLQVHSPIREVLVSPDREKRPGKQRKNIDKRYAYCQDSNCPRRGQLFLRTNMLTYDKMLFHSEQCINNFRKVNGTK